MSTLETTHFSEALARSLGLGDSRNVALARTVHSDDWAAVLAACHEVATGRAPRRLEYRALSGSGRASRVTGELRPGRRVTNGESSASGAILVELWGERDESRVSSFVRAVFDSRPECLVVFDADGSLVAWNARFEQLCGAPVETCDEAEILSLASARLEEGAALIEEIRRPPEGDRSRLVRCRDGRLLELTGQRLARGWVWSFGDVGEQARMEARYRDLYNTDRGIGIPADEIPQLFQRFFRSRTTPVKHYGGLGLGLYVCRYIVEKHGGRIWAESELGCGTTFHVALPLAADRSRDCT